MVATGLSCFGASGADHALPHTSAPDKLLPPKEPRDPRGVEEATGAGAAVGAGLGWADRLKIEVDVEMAAAAG